MITLLITVHRFVSIWINRGQQSAVMVIGIFCQGIGLSHNSLPVCSQKIFLIIGKLFAAATRIFFTDQIACSIICKLIKTLIRIYNLCNISLFIIFRTGFVSVSVFIVNTVFLAVILFLYVCAILINLPNRNFLISILKNHFAVILEIGKNGFLIFVIIEDHVFFSGNQTLTYRPPAMIIFCGHISLIVLIRDLMNTMIFVIYIWNLSTIGKFYPHQKLIIVTIFNGSSNGICDLVQLSITVFKFQPLSGCKCHLDQLMIFIFKSGPVSTSILNLNNFSIGII